MIGLTQDALIHLIINLKIHIEIIVNNGYDYKDHSHMFLNCLPTLSPSDIMQQIKGYTSKILREEFSELSKMPSLWTRSYFVSTAGNVCSETIKKYVENQKKRY